MTETASETQLTEEHFETITQLMYEVAKKLRTYGTQQQQGDIIGFGAGQKSYIDLTIQSLKDKSQTEGEGYYNVEALKEALKARFTGDAEVITNATIKTSNINGTVSEESISQLVARRFALAAICCKAIEVAINEAGIGQLEQIDSDKLTQKAIVESHEQNERLYEVATRHIFEADKATSALFSQKKSEEKWSKPPTSLWTGSILREPPSEAARPAPSSTVAQQYQRLPLVSTISPRRDSGRSDL